MATGADRKESRRADSRLQVVTLEENVRKFGVNFFGMTDKRQGIVHVRPRRHSDSASDSGELIRSPALAGHRPRAGLHAPGHDGRLR